VGEKHKQRRKWIEKFWNGKEINKNKIKAIKPEEKTGSRCLKFGNFRNVSVSSVKQTSVREGTLLYHVRISLSDANIPQQQDKPSTDM
jgi:5'(3')-deoxyribonucleotidase